MISSFASRFYRLCGNGLEDMVLRFRFSMMSGVRIAFLGLAFSFCFQTYDAHARPLDPLTPDEVYARLSDLQHLPYNGIATEKDDGAAAPCVRSQVTIQVGDAKTGTTWAQTLSVLRPDRFETKAPSPVMIIVPTMEGVTVIERSIVTQFCNLGIATIIADVNTNQVPAQIPSWGMEDKNNRHAIISLRTVIDYAITSPYFDPQRIGIIGLSLGAVTSSFLAGVEADRLASVVLVLPGGNLPYVLAVSDNSRLTELREKRMAHEHIKTKEKYEDVLREMMRFDPMHFAARGKHERIFMVISKSDTKVPTSVQRDLFHELGRPSSVEFTGGHVQTIISLTYFYFDYVTDFVRSQFGLKPKMRGTFHEIVDIPPEVEAQF